MNKKVQKLLQQVDKLCAWAGMYIQEPVFIKDGVLVYEVNTSCHCHPEMQQKEIHMPNFIAWLEENYPDAFTTTST